MRGIPRVCVPVFHVEAEDDAAVMSVALRSAVIVDWSTIDSKPFYVRS